MSTLRPCRFSIASINVASWLAHSDFINDIAADVVAVQETRLTQDGQLIAADAAKSGKRQCVWGKPQPIRAGTRKSILDAKQGGVGFHVSGKHVVTPSPRTVLGEQLFQTGRWQSIAVKIDNSATIFHVVTYYGIAGANEGGEKMTENEAFLTDVFLEAHSLGNDVPVVVIGDLNVKVENSHILSHLVSEGFWMDAGLQTAILKNKEPDNTFERGTTTSRIDLCFVNTAAANYFSDFAVLDVSDNGISDHKQLLIEFEVNTKKYKTLAVKDIKGIPDYKPPSSEDSNFIEDLVIEENGDSFYEAWEAGDIDGMWHNWCVLAERFLLETAVLQTGDESYLTDDRYRGRGLGAEVSKKTMGCPNQCESAHGLDSEKLGIAKLIDELEQAVGSEVVGRSMAWKRACSLGTQFLRGGKFKDVWDVDHVPTTFNLETLKDLAKITAQEIAVKDRTKLIRKYKEKRNAKVNDDIGALFREFRDAEEAPLSILKRTDGTMTGNISEMDKLLQEAWLPIFAKHDVTDEPEPCPRRFLDEYGHLIKKHKQRLHTINMKELKWAIARLSKHGAGGLDAWKPADVKKLPDRILEMILIIFDVVEDKGVWPSQLTWAGVTLIPKGEGGEPLSMRPITVSPIFYRIWAAIRMRHSMKWQEKWINAGQHGSRAKHSTLDALARISAEFEIAMLNGEDLTGMAVDLSKAFDNIPVDVTFALLKALGMDPGLHRALQGFYKQLMRRFKIGACVGESFRSTNGILQGCPLSVMLLNALMSVLHSAIGGNVVCESYVDDLTVVAKDPNDVQCASTALEKFLDLTGQVLNEKKTVVMSLNDPVDIIYKNKVLPHGNGKSVKILGVKFKCGGGECTAVQDLDLLEKMVILCNRIRYSGFNFQQRALLCGALVMAKVGYGLEIADFPQNHERRLRIAIGYAVWQKTSKQRCPGLLFTLPVKGHVVDPSQCPFFRRIAALRQVGMNSPQLVERLRGVWDRIRVRRPRRHGGLLNNLNLTQRRLGVARRCTDLYSIPSGEGELCALTTTKHKWSHAARDLCRQCVWKQVSKDRHKSGDLRGLENGVDRDRTMLLYSRSDRKAQGILRKILLAAVWTERRRSFMPECASNGVCRFCQCGAYEDLFHLWWECKAWQDVRDCSLDPTIFPACLSKCGIATHDVHRDVDVCKVQASMARIFAARFDGLHVGSL